MTTLERAPAPGAPLDLDRFEVLTFDCYGTLIDWEAGIVAAARPILAAHRADVANEELLAAYASAEADAEAGPYRPYREILAVALIGVGRRLGFAPLAEEARAFAASVVDWPAFPDSREALARLALRYRLGVITNCDDDLFAASNRRLGEPFRWVVTAQQLGSYKPASRNFTLALERIGLPPARVLHVAQSLYHDHVPAQALGLATVWVNRRGDRPGAGATPPAEVRPDLEIANLASLADLAGA